MKEVTHESIANCALYPLFLCPCPGGCPFDLVHGEKIKDGQEHQDRPKRLEQPPPDISNEPVKLHIREGLLEVNRLPEDVQEKP